MLVDFNSLPDDSRVWIYQCNRSFNSIESELITSKVIDFISNWEAHGKPLSQVMIFHIIALLFWL